MSCTYTSTSQFDVSNWRYRTTRGHDKTCRLLKIFVSSKRKDDHVYNEVSSCSVFFMSNTNTHTHMSFIHSWHTDPEKINCCGILIIIRRKITYIKFNRFDILKFCAWMTNLTKQKQRRYMIRFRRKYISIPQ